MRFPLIYRIVAPILLIVFTITSCNYFNMPEPPDNQPRIPSVPVGKGDIQVVYLDEDYQPTTNDIGKMALYVENNDLAQDVIVLSEIRDNHIDNDVVVRVINSQNSSIVSMFYYSGQSFPYKIVISMDGEDATGVFSMYNSSKQTYSVEFSNEGGESELFEDLVLNKSVFSLYSYSSGLTATQNVRLSNIITSLALWNSLAFQIDDDFSVNARWSFRLTLKRLIVGVLAVVAVVAFAAVCIIASPAAVAVIGPVISNISLTAATQSIAAGIVVSATAAALFAGAALPEDFGMGSSHDPPPPAPNQRPKIEITLNGEEIKNNQMPPYYLSPPYSTPHGEVFIPGESISFDFIIISSDFTADAVIDYNRLLYAFDPYNFDEIGLSTGNAKYFDIKYAVIGKNHLKFIFTRNDIPKPIESLDIRVQFIIPFRQAVVINNNDTSQGVFFKENINAQETLRKDIFIFNFTVRAE